MTAVMPPDLELWLCPYLRSLLDDVDGVRVAARMPEDYDGAYPLVTIRDDGGGRDDFLRYDRSVAVNVTGWTRSRDRPCKDLARRVMALMTDEPVLQTASGSPVLAVDFDSCNGPYAITDDPPYAHYYMTVGLIVAGEY